MVVDLRIRPLGRAKISKDSVLGFQRIARRYVVEGPKASKIGLDDRFDATANRTEPGLFRLVGEPDEEFADHYLVNQQVEPSKSVDKAYLTREYAEIRNTFSAESVSESGDLKRITRKYAVLRQVNGVSLGSVSLGTFQVSLGYSAGAWTRYPKASSDNDPWDYVPKVVEDTSPSGVSYDDDGGGSASLPTIADAQPSVLKTATLGLDGNDDPVPLGTALGACAMGVKWVRAAAQVDRSNPGVDIWSVSWVAPVIPYWATGAGRGRGTSVKLPDTIHFDSWGLKVTKFGVQSSGGPTIAWTFTFYSVGGSLPDCVVPFAHGGSTQPCVSMDLYLLLRDGNNRVLTIKQHFPNALYNKETLSDNLHFPPQMDLDRDQDPRMGNSGGDGQTPPRLNPTVKIATGHAGSKFVFAYPYTPVPAHTFPPEGFPMYQGQLVQRTGGHISWTNEYVSGGTIATLSSTKIRPIFSHGAEKIWKIQLTYVS